MLEKKVVNLRLLVVGEADPNAGKENPEGFNQSLVAEGGYAATVFYGTKEAADKRAPQLPPAGIVDITAYADCFAELTRNGQHPAVWFNIDNRQIMAVKPVENPTPEDYARFNRTVYTEKRTPKEWAARQAVA